MAGAVYRLFKAIGDTAAAQVINRKFDGDFVAGQNLDVMHAHLARDMSENLMAVLELDFEHSVRESLQNGALKFDDVFFSQESSSSQILPITLCVAANAATEYFTRGKTKSRVYLTSFHEDTTTHGAFASHVVHITTFLPSP